MAALEDQAAGKKLPKVVKKKPLPVVVRSSTVPQAPAMTTETTVLSLVGYSYRNAFF